MADRAARRVLTAWIVRLRPASETLSRARWAAACDSTDAAREQAEEAARALDRALSDPRGIEKVEQSLAEPIHDRDLRRALECLRLQLLPHRVPRPEGLVALEAGLQERFARFQAQVGNQRLAAHEVSHTLRTATDSTRLEETWRGAIHIGVQVGADVRSAVRQRNALARSLGLSDFRALRLVCEETDAGELDAFLTEIAESTDAAWRVEKAALDERLAARYEISTGALMPWHYGEVFFQALPPDAARPDPFETHDPVALVRRTYTGMGLDVEAALESSDLFPRKGKNPHAFCTDLDRAGDVRVLANIVPSRRWTRTMLHEFGHAAYDLHLNTELPWNLVRPPHACLTEGVAMLLDRLPNDAAWCEGIAGVEASPGLAAHARADLLTFLRWGIVVSRFEERLYADPEQDLDAIWWDLVERYQLLRRPDPLPEDAWAAKIHLACFPVYYHSYLLGACVASQLGRHVRDSVPGGTLVDNPKAGRWLCDAVFAPSAVFEWNELMQRATGSKVNAEALLADAVGAP